MQLSLFAELTFCYFSWGTVGAGFETRVALTVVSAFGDAEFLVFFDEINRLREAAGLTPRTIPQAKDAYRRKLDR